jgi:hypothetical protein
MRFNLNGLCKEIAVCLLRSMNWFVKYNSGKTWEIIDQKASIPVTANTKPVLLPVLHELWLVIITFRECYKCVTNSKTKKQYSTNRPPTSDTFPTRSFSSCHSTHNPSTSNTDKFPTALDSVVTGLVPIMLRVCFCHIYTHNKAIEFSSAYDHGHKMEIWQWKFHCWQHEKV